MESSQTDWEKFLVVLRRDWKTVPNLITAIRMIGTLALVPLILSSSTQAKIWAVIVFVVLASTDKLDGWLARKLGQVTELGKLIDPVMDKELILVTLGTLLFDAWRRNDLQMFYVLLGALAILAVREIAVARIKQRALHRGEETQSAIQSGRVTMTVQVVAVGVILLPIETPAARAFKLFLLLASLAMSLYSWWDYHRKYDRRVS